MISTSKNNPHIIIIFTFAYQCIILHMEPSSSLWNKPGSDTRLRMALDGQSSSQALASPLLSMSFDGQPTTLSSSPIHLQTALLDRKFFI